MTVTYMMTKDIYSLGVGFRISYGIATYAAAENNGTTAILFSIHDITSGREKLEKLVHDCNRLKLSSVHLRDVVDDFLND